MRLKIFTVYHFVPLRYQHSEIFAPFVTGQSVGMHPHIVSDEFGDNISAEVSCCEMRAHYFVWKNLLSSHDYVGFQHYRRFLFLDHLPGLAAQPLIQQMRAVYLADPLVVELTLNRPAFEAYADAMNQLSDEDIGTLKTTIRGFDIVTPKPWGLSMGEQYSAMHNGADWEHLVEVLRTNSRFEREDNHITGNLRLLHTGNMFIMRAELFSDYMAFWREAILEVSKRISISADAYQSRVLGFLSERIFTMYLFQLRMERPGLRVLEVPYITGPQRDDAEPSVRA